MTNLLRENEFSLRAGQNAFGVLLVEICINTPVSAETGRWFRMDSNPLARSTPAESFLSPPPFCSNFAVDADLQSSC
jgi:hypothetical protein